MIIIVIIVITIITFYSMQFDKYDIMMFSLAIYIYIYIIYIYIYIYYIYIYIYIYICIFINVYILFGLRTFVTSTECSTYGVSISCLKKRRLYASKFAIIRVYYLFYSVKSVTVYFSIAQIAYLMIANALSFTCIQVSFLETTYVTYIYAYIYIYIYKI